MLYAETREKPVQFNLQRARDAFLAITPTPDLAMTDLKDSSPQPLIHGRLPWVMGAVRERIGDAEFRRAIRTLFDRYRYRTFTLDQFIAVFENAARPDARPTVRALFGRPGVCRQPSRGLLLLRHSQRRRARLATWRKGEAASPTQEKGTRMKGS